MVDGKKVIIVTCDEIITWMWEKAWGSFIGMLKDWIIYRNLRK